MISNHCHYTICSHTLWSIRKYSGRLHCS